MRLDELIRGPRRPTHAQLLRRRRRVAALAAVAALAGLAGALAGAGVGTDGGSVPAPRAPAVGWYGHLRALAGGGRRSLSYAERAHEDAAIGRTLARTPFVRLAGRRHRLIALTFDDGPGPYSEALVEALRRLGVPGTFFVVGRELRDYGAAPLQREVDLGLPVGDHTQDHLDLSRLAPRDQRAEILRGARALSSFGAPRPRLFRPPYGAYDAATLAILRRERMLTVLWSIDSEDYLKPGVARIVRNVVANARPGAIVLMHDAGGDRSQTIAALPRIVGALRRRGYRFVTVPRLLLENPPPADQRLPPGFNSGGAG